MTWRLVLLPAAAAALLALVFVWNTTRFDLPARDSYYVAKSLWIVYLGLVPTIGAGVGLAFSAVPVGGAPGRSGRDSLARSARMSVAGVAAAALVWSSAPTPNAPNGSIDYYSVPVGGQALLDRDDIFRGIAQGDVVARAAELTRSTPRRLAIAWDSGDLLTNRWLGSLRGNLTGHADRVLSSLLGAPYAEPAAAALRQALVSDPTLRVVVVWANPDSRELLRQLKAEFGPRILLRRM